MPRTKGTKNPPGHRAGGRRPGSGRKRRAPELRALTSKTIANPRVEETSTSISKAPQRDETNGARNQGNSDAQADSSPKIRLSEIHPDLVPFLSVPHHIPLLCLFDASRYPAVVPSSVSFSSSAPNESDTNTKIAAESSHAAPSAPDNAAHRVTVHGDPLDTDELSLPSGSPTRPQMGHSLLALSAVPSISGTLKDGPEVGKRKRRRCLVCMNAGRVSHAYICPGRGNRSVCATAREIKSNGGTLPPDASKRNSKNTQIPVVTPALFPYPTSDTPMQIPNFQLIGMIPPQTSRLHAPLGYLPNGSARVRRPRRCKICTARGEDGTRCIGRSSRLKCPYYTEDADAADMDLDQQSDEEEQDVEQSLRSTGAVEPPTD